MTRRAVYCIIALMMIFALGGCGAQQADMGISLEKFIQGYNNQAQACGAEPIGMELYRQNEGEENGYLLQTLPGGTGFYAAVTGEGKVASIQLFLKPEDIRDDALQEFQNTAVSCIQTLDGDKAGEILSLTGLKDISKSAKVLQDDPEAYFLYFYDTNSKGLDPVHGKQYRLWYNNGLKYTILYPLQG